MQFADFFLPSRRKDADQGRCHRVCATRHGGLGQGNLERAQAWQQPWTEEAVQSFDPAKSYYLYCRSGNRSGQAAKLLRAKGFDSVFNAGAYGSLEGL